jgi:hypothetical protein
MTGISVGGTAVSISVSASLAGGGGSVGWATAVVSIETEMTGAAKVGLVTGATVADSSAMRVGVAAWASDALGSAVQAASKTLATKIIMRKINKFCFFAIGDENN